jgi:hypothetical protein
MVPAVRHRQRLALDANLWDSSLLPADAARRVGRPAGFKLHAQPA